MPRIKLRARKRASAAPAATALPAVHEPQAPRRDLVAEALAGKVDPFTLPHEQYHAWARKVLGYDPFKKSTGRSESEQRAALNAILIAEGYPPLKVNPALTEEALAAEQRKRDAIRAEEQRVRKETGLARLAQHSERKRAAEGPRPKREKKDRPKVAAGHLFVVVCATCGDLKARKNYSDADYFRKAHAAPGHAVTLEERDASTVSIGKRAPKPKAKSSKPAAKKSAQKAAPIAKRSAAKAAKPKPTKKARR